MALQVSLCGIVILLQRTYLTTLFIFRARQKLIRIKEENQVGIRLSAAEVATIITSYENHFGIRLSAAIVSSSSSGSSSTPKPLSDEAKIGLTRWVEEHQIDPFPSRGEKEAFKKLYGIENDPQLDGFLCRARKKYKKNLHNNVTKQSAAPSPSAHKTTTITNNNAITPGSSMKIPKKSSLHDNVTPAKRFVARPSKFGRVNNIEDQTAAASTSNVQSHTQWLQSLPKTAAHQKINTPIQSNEQRLDQTVLESSLGDLPDMPPDKTGDSLDNKTAEDKDLSARISKYLSTEYQGEKKAEEQLLKVDGGDEPYIGSQYPSVKQPCVVASTDYYPGCNLKGAHPLPGSTKYKSIIFYEGSRYSLGKYDFVSDAALAYDKAALSIGPYWDINFASWDEYIATRTLEVMRKGSDQVDLTSVLETISSRANEVVSKVVNEAELNDFEWVSFVLFMLSYAHFLYLNLYSVTVFIYQRMNKV